MKIEFPYWRGKFENYKKLFTVYNYFYRSEKLNFLIGEIIFE